MSKAYEASVAKGLPKVFIKGNRGAPHRLHGHSVHLVPSKHLSRDDKDVKERAIRQVCVPCAFEGRGPQQSGWEGNVGEFDHLQRERSSVG